jgi:hypothetical protein
MFEHFLDQEYIESLTGVSLAVNRPVKYYNNPIFGASSWTWDRDVMWCDVLRFGDEDYRLWYGAGPVGGEYNVDYLHTCYATSTDGISYTRPTLNIYAYAGNSNNNIIARRYGHQIHVWPEGPSNQRYLMAMDMKHDEANADDEEPPYSPFTNLLIYASADGINWNWNSPLKVIDNTTRTKECHGLTRMFDGRWVVIFNYSAGNYTDDRRMGVAISATSDPTSAYTYHYGQILDNGTEDQPYSLAIHPYKGLYYGVVIRYQQYSTNRIDLVKLYVSRDMLNWTLLDDNWLPAGATTGHWDYGMILARLPFIRACNTWRIYYGATNRTHNGANPNYEGRMGFAEIGYGRVGKAQGDGTITTTAQTITSGEKLYLNCKTTGGSLKVELLNTSDEVVSGYASTDFDTIQGADVYEMEATWGTQSLPSGEYKLKFYLEDAELYSYEITDTLEAAPPCTTPPVTQCSLPAGEYPGETEIDLSVLWSGSSPTTIYYQWGTGENWQAYEEPFAVQNGTLYWYGVDTALNVESQQSRVFTISITETPGTFFQMLGGLSIELKGVGGTPLPFHFKGE